MSKHFPILNVIVAWFERYFSDPDAVSLFFFILIVLCLIQWFGKILEPILVSIGLAYLLDSVVGLLKRLHIPNGIAVFFVFIAFIGFCFGIAVGVLPLLWKQSTAFIKAIPSILNHSQVLFSHLIVEHPNLVTQGQYQGLISGIRSQMLHLGHLIFTYSLSSIESVVSLVLYVILVPVMVLFMLKDRQIILSFFQNYLPDNRGLISQVWHDVNVKIGQYIRGRVIEVVLISSVSCAAFSFLGLPYAALMGASLGVSVIVPYVGAILVTIPLVIIALMQWGAGAHFVFFICIYILIVMADAYVLVPMLFSDILKLNPLVIIIATLVFGAFWGFWGVFLSIPLASVVKAVLDAWPNKNHLFTVT